MGHPVSLSVAVAQVVTLRGIQSASLDSLVLRGFPPATENPAFIVEVWDAVILQSYFCGIFGDWSEKVRYGGGGRGREICENAKVDTRGKIIGSDCKI